MGDETPLKASIEAARYVAIDKLHWPLPPVRPAEDQQALLSVFPLVVGNLVLFSTTEKVFAFDLATGKPAWPVADGTRSVPATLTDGVRTQDRPAGPSRELGEIYSGAKYRDDAINPSPGSASFQAFGAPRFTLTADGNRLYARLGSPITGRLEGRPSTGSSYLVCLDLSAQGLLLWRTPGENGQDDRWTFEGAPVVRGNNVYVVMRYSDVRPQVHVACLDARSGGLRWRKLVCTNETVVGGQWPEITSNLLTLAGENLYLNTNLGAIAALSAADGEIRWISGYPRAGRTSQEKTPRISIAISRRPFTIAGVCSWHPATVRASSRSTRQPARCCGRASFSGIEQNMHLLGVGGDNLIASGPQIWWINVDSGLTTNYWHDNTARGYGRGALVGDEVYWPMRGPAGSQIRRFKQRVPEMWSQDNSYFDADDPILLDRFDPPLSAGNLVAANGYLLIATPTKLICFGTGKATAPNERILTQNAPK